MNFYKHPLQELYNILEANLPAFFPLVDKYISDEYMKELEEYLFHSEYGLLYENFCDIIEFYKIPISQENFNMISKLGQLMKYDQKQWIELENFIQID